MRIRHRHSHTSQSIAYMNKNLKRLWLLRILISLDAHKQFVRQKDFVHDDLARELGFEKYVEDSDLFNRNTILTALREQLAKIELRIPAIADKSTLWVNVHQLGQALALSDAELKILYFSVVVRIENHFEECLFSVGTLSITALERLFSVCLGKLCKTSASKYRT